MTHNLFPCNSVSFFPPHIINSALQEFGCCIMHIRYASCTGVFLVYNLLNVSRVSRLNSAENTLFCVYCRPLTHKAVLLLVF
jgi:hypothetical protein